MIVQGSDREVSWAWRGRSNYVKGAQMFPGRGDPVRFILLLLAYVSEKLLDLLIRNHF